MANLSTMNHHEKNCCLASPAFLVFKQSGFFFPFYMNNISRYPGQLIKRNQKFILCENYLKVDNLTTFDQTNFAYFTRINT